jgi:HAD superfamily hydrolase (TIGR01509 family)
VFDFDGLIADTETPLFDSWCQEFRDHGVELSIHEWIKCVGAGPEGWNVLDHLEELVGPVDRPVLDRRNVARHHAAIVDLQALPGVVDLLDAACRQEVPCAVASSSGSPWVERFLVQIGIRERFLALATRETAPRAKPAPDLFLEACRRLDADPARSVALEDSVNGVTAAKAAGMVCVAVPNSVTMHVDLSHADLVVESLEGASIERFGELVARSRWQART